MPALKGVVRGKMGCSGWVVAPAEGGSASRVTYVSVTDLKVRSIGFARRGGISSEHAYHGALPVHSDDLISCVRTQTCRAPRT